MSIEPPLLRQTMCPYCGTVHNAIGGVDGKTPEPKLGDTMICATCGSASKYEGGTLMPFLNHAELISACVADPALGNALWHWYQVCGQKAETDVKSWTVPPTATVN